MGALHVLDFLKRRNGKNVAFSRVRDGLIIVRNRWMNTIDAVSEVSYCGRKPLGIS